MITADREELWQLEYITAELLQKLGISAHRVGYKCLMIGVVSYAMDDSQSITKELYPRIARQLGIRDWHPVESAIRNVIRPAWQRKSEVWKQLFPDFEKPPTNKQFIARLAVYVQLEIRAV